MKFARWMIAATLLASSALAEPTGTPDKAARCIDSSTRAQTLRDSGQLLEAQRELAACVDESCPPSVRKACGDWILDIENRMPSIAVRVVDEEQRDMEHAHAWIDGAPASLDGRAIPVNPGKHVIVGETSSGTRNQTSVVLAEAEKRRVVTVTFSKSSKAKVVLLGVGAASLAAAGVFGFWGMRDWVDLQAGCRPHCSDDAVGGTQTKFIVADIALGVSVITLGVAAALYIASARTTTTALSRPLVAF